MPGEEDKLEQEGLPTELRHAFRLLRGRRGLCPEPEALLRLHSGELAESEAARVHQHARACGVCEAALQGLKRFDEAAAGEEAGELPPGTAERLAQR